MYTYKNKKDTWLCWLFRYTWIFSGYLLNCKFHNAFLRVKKKKVLLAFASMMWLLGFIIVKRLTFSIMCKAINNLCDAAVRFIDMESSCSLFWNIFATNQLECSFRYGVQDMDESAKRIYKVALGTPDDHLVILLAHNGPSGILSS